MKLLRESGTDFEQVDYTKEPLSREELARLVELLGVEPRALLRKRDRAYREAGLTGEEGEDELIRLMSRHPTLLQRPIGVAGGRAVLGRPPENLLELAGTAEA